MNKLNVSPTFHYYYYFPFYSILFYSFLFFFFLIVLSTYYFILRYKIRYIVRKSFKFIKTECWSVALVYLEEDKLWCSLKAGTNRFSSRPSLRAQTWISSFRSFMSSWRLCFHNVSIYLSIFIYIYIYINTLANGKILEVMGRNCVPLASNRALCVVVMVCLCNRSGLLIQTKTFAQRNFMKSKNHIPI